MSASDAPLRVLVLDDHDSLRRNLVALLEDEGFTVLEANSGEVAETVLASEAVDIAIVDIRLPGMSGIEFIERAARRYPAIRCVVHTGSSDFVLPHNANELRLSPHDIFFKPIENLDVFFNRLRHLRKETRP